MLLVNIQDLKSPYNHSEVGSEQNFSNMLPCEDLSVSGPEEVL